MAHGCQRKEKVRRCVISSTVTLIVTCSYPGLVICPCAASPGRNGPVSFTPNQEPNSSALGSARQTRPIGALRTTVFSMRSVESCFIGNLQVAGYGATGG